MKRCEHCGNDLEDKARFCPFCGENVVDASAADGVAGARGNDEETAPIAAEMPGDASGLDVFVGVSSSDQPCGSSDPVAFSDSGDAAPSPARRSKKPLVFGAIAVVVVAAAALAIGLGMNAEKQRDPEEVIEGLLIQSAFPDEAIRETVIAQVDTDGNGVLSEDEAQAVTGLVFMEGETAFVLNGDQVNVETALAQSKEAKAAVAETAQADADGTAEGSDADTKGSSAGVSSSDAEAAAIEEETEGTAGGDASPDQSEEALSPSLWAGGMGVFPNLQTLICRGSGLTELDLSSNPALTYVDCRNNGLETLDLSNNGEIDVMFCDPDVELTGLEQAGLYFEDLVASASSDIYDQPPMVVEYDSTARPVRLLQGDRVARTYEYDDAGRLTRAYSDASSWSEYKYNEQGLLAEKDSFFSLAVDSSEVQRSVFSYNPAGQLIRLIGSYGDNAPDYDAEFTYDGATVASRRDKGLSSPETEDETYVFSVNGLLFSKDVTPDYEAGYFDSNNVTYGYNEHKLMESKVRYTHFDGAGYWGDCQATRMANGGLRSLAISDSDSYGDIKTNLSFTCNADGYIESVSATGDSYPASYQMSISYIKRVGSLADLDDRRCIPRFEVALCSDTWINGLYGTLDDEWYQDTGSSIPLTVVEHDPGYSVFEAMGLTPQMTANENQVDLALRMAGRK